MASSYVRLDNLITDMPAVHKGYILALQAGINMSNKLLFASTNGALEYKYNRIDTLPEAAFTAINEDPTDARTTPLPMTLGLKIVSRSFSLDDLLPATEQGAQRQAAAVSISRTFDKYFFQGDSNGNQKEFDGIAKIASDNSAEVEMATNGAVLAIKNLDELIELAHGCADGDVARMELLMNNTMNIQLKALLDAKTALTKEYNMAGGYVTMYSGIPIRIVRKDVANAAILPDTEELGSSGAVCTSIYCVTYARNEAQPGVFAVMSGAPVEGFVGTGVGKRTLARWPVAVGCSHKYGVCALKGIKKA